MNAEIAKALAAPDVKDKLIAQAVDIRPSTPEQLGALTKARFEQMGKIIKDAGIVAE
jgi:tripartite-type tricarboxylate transporter receptor subunit TctC